MDVEFLHMNDHIRYGRSPTGFVLQSTPQPVETTNHILADTPFWKVLYFYNDTDDELVEFPYVSFDINVPTSSQSTIDSVEVFIEKESKELISLGSYHPADTISIVDFLGYYEARKMITKKTNFQKAFNSLPDFSMPAGSRQSSSRNQNQRIQSVRNQGYVSMNVNTRAKSIDALTANRKINNAISTQVESGTLQYKIKITHIDGTTSQMPVQIDISDRPSIPEEPEDNSSFAIGNKTILPSAFAVPTSAVTTINAEIQQVAVPLKTTTIIGFNR